MLSYIKGTLEQISEKSIVVEAGGLGYSIFVSSSLQAGLPALHQNVKIYTHMNVKEDGISLYGFLSLEELKLFHQLITVSGIGPKGAMGFLEQMTPSQVIMAILSGDEKMLSKAPGIGKKTAQRVILELKDKFHPEEVFSSAQTIHGMSSPTESSGARWETIDALTSLGYGQSEAAKAVTKVYQDGLSTEQLLKKALKEFVKF